MANNVAPEYLGTLGTVFVANYADIKINQVIPYVSNSTFVKAMAVGASIFYPARANSTIGMVWSGAGSWAIGSLLEPYIKNYVQRVHYTTQMPSVTPQAPAATASA